MNPAYSGTAARAGHRCEYCRAPEIVFNFHFEVEHILPLSRGGERTESNCALACRSCNVRKSAQVDFLDAESNTMVPIFHPRKDMWNHHFLVDMETGMIEGLTSVGPGHGCVPGNE